MLMHKHYGNPIFDVMSSSIPAWRRAHVANASILTPEETGDGKYKMYMRGSGFCDSYGCRDQIGLFTQNSSGFNPLGSWRADSRNPILRNGSDGPYDALHLLDTVAVKAQGKILVYYKSRYLDGRMGYAGAESTDGGNIFQKFNNNPFSNKGLSDVVYMNNTFYHFHGHYNRNTHQLQMALSTGTHKNQLDRYEGIVVPHGSNGQYDDKSVFGGKIFTVPGDARWFMVYQLSANHTDFPERMHIAYSTNLKNWTKVSNSLPFMMRGGPREFDQGGIWTSDVIIKWGKIYLYYEGWGSRNDDSSKRNTVYYGGGNSRMGVASVSVKDFLRWVNGSSAKRGPIYKMINKHSKKGLDVAGRGTSNGTNIQQWDWSNASHKKFQFWKQSDGSYVIKPTHTNKCLDVAGASTSDHANIHLWSCHGGDNQRWYVTQVDGWNYEIKSKKSGKCLEVQGGRTNNGGTVVQYRCTRGNNQRWSLSHRNQ